MRSAAWCTMTILRKLFSNQTFFASKPGGSQSQGENYDDDAAKTLLKTNFFASNQRAQDVSPGRIHKHTPRLCRLWCLLLAPRSFSLSVRPQPVCVWAGGVLSVVSKCFRCTHLCAVGPIWREAITRRKLRWRCCENSIATKLCLQATNARRTEKHTDRHSPGRIHTHLPSLACVVSCWRLVAILCRFARNLSALASSVSLLRVAAALWRAASLSLSCCGLYRDSLSRLRLHSVWSSVSRIELGSIDPSGRLLMCDSMHETAATPSVSLATVAMCVCAGHSCDVRVCLKKLCI